MKAAAEKVGFVAFFYGNLGHEGLLRACRLHGLFLVSRRSEKYFFVGEGAGR